jgi:hypothetical protein
MKSALSLALIPIMALSAMGKAVWEEKSLEQVLTHIRTLETPSQIEEAQRLSRELYKDRQK